MTLHLWSRMATCLQVLHGYHRDSVDLAQLLRPGSFNILSTTLPLAAHKGLARGCRVVANGKEREGTLHSPSCKEWHRR